MRDLFCVYALREVEGRETAQIFRVDALDEVGGWCERIDREAEAIASYFGGERYRATSGRGTRTLRFRFAGQEAAEKAKQRIETVTREHFDFSEGAILCGIVEPGADAAEATQDAEKPALVK